MNLELINTEIKRQGRKKCWLANRMEIHPKTLSRFLKGQSDLGVKEVAILLEILNLKFEALMKKAS